MRGVNVRRPRDGVARNAALYRHAIAAWRCSMSLLPDVYRCPSPKPLSRGQIRTELRGVFSMRTTTDGLSALTVQIDQGCLALFDLWCERRSVIKLAYLMHGWPMSAPAPSQVASLSSSLRELMKSYPETFDVEDRLMVAEVVLICERILEHGASEPQSVLPTGYH
jgi:hypothetical protein